MKKKKDESTLINNNSFHLKFYVTFYFERTTFRYLIGLPLGRVPGMQRGHCQSWPLDWTTPTTHCCTVCDIHTRSCSLRYWN